MKWIGTQTIYDHVRLNKGITLDSVSITTIQASSESFADNDTSLMTSAAIDDRINTAVTAEDLDLTADSGTAAVDLNSQALAVTGGTGITTSATGQAVTLNVDAELSHVTALGTLTKLTLDGDRSVTPGDGAMIHLDTSTITDNNTSAEATATKYTHVNFEQPTVAATNEDVTITDAATFYIGRAPAAGTNMTLTNAWALWVDSGNVRFDGTNNTIGTVTSGNWQGTAIASAYLDSDTAHLSGTQTFTGLKKFSGKIDGPLEIEQGASGGAPALLIDNDDVDKHTLKLEAANTTANTFQIAVPSQTTGNVIKVNADSLTTGSAIDLDIDDALTGSEEKSLVKIDYDKAGVRADGEDSTTTGLDINMADAATNHSGSAFEMTGIIATVDSASTSGDNKNTGLVCRVVDATANVGIDLRVEDGGTDILMRSDTDINDYCTIATTASGATTITTVDGGAAAAHFEIAADGNITLDPQNATTGVIIDGSANTTTHALNIDCDSLTTASAINLDIDDALTTTAAKNLVDLNFTKAGDTASGQSSTTRALKIAMDDQATSNVGTISMTGIDLDIASANANGSVSHSGIDIAMSGGDAALSFGLRSTLEYGTDIKMMSHADTSDYCTINTTTNGATTITTVDGGAAAAHFEIAADGDITLDAAGTIKLEGPVRPTGQLQTTYYMFRDGLDDTKHYVGLQEADAESGTASNKNLPILAPVAGKLLKVFLRATTDLSARTFTWRLETHNTSSATGGTPTVIGTVSGAGCTASSMTTYDFTAVTNTINAGDTVQLSIQSDDTASTCNYFITCLWEWDFSSIG